MRRDQFYINGKWVEPATRSTLDVINPATGLSVAKIALGTAEDVDAAVAAARAAFDSYSRTSREYRMALLTRLLEGYQKRLEEFAQAICQEMGAPLTMCRELQAQCGPWHLGTTLEVLRTYAFQEERGSTQVIREPVGVCGLITPWNWPMNQLMAKVAPALAAGCTMVLKPSEIAPLSAMLFAEVVDAADLPPGVFNLVNGLGPTVGHAIASHPDVDLVSFTGSVAAGVSVAKAAAPSIKKVTQELGGKSANIILEDADLESAVTNCVASCMMNSGQSCNAPTRLLVPAAKHDQAVAIARAAAEGLRVGDPLAADTTLGPVVSEKQWNKIQKLIQTGLDEGATLVTGGTGRPAGLTRGFYVKPTIFANVSNSMTIAREEIFGPVLVILKYRDEDEAVRIANDSVYGLSGYVSSASIERARSTAARLRTGNVHLNDAHPDFGAPFGGYKQSGNGREWGREGMEEFLEFKSVFGYRPAAHG